MEQKYTSEELQQKWNNQYITYFKKKVMRYEHEKVHFSIFLPLLF